MTKEFNLSEKINNTMKYEGANIGFEDVKEFIRLTEEENKDFETDIISLIEINDYGKEDLIAKIKRLCKAHREERDKLAGDKLK